MTNAVRKPKTRILVNLAKVKRAQKVFGAKSQIEAIEHALDFVIEEGANNRLAWKSNQRFIKSGGEIKDAFGKLDR
jgi:hypothetical protein